MCYYWVYEYDLQNRLIKTSYSGKGKTNLKERASYTYDYRGLLVRKSYQDYDKSNYIELDKPTSSKEITEYYEYTPDGRVLYNERKENTIVNKTDYIWANTTLWCEINEGVLYYHHTDHLGTTEVITDSNGNIVWHADYEAFGSVMNERGDENFTPNYTGKFFDESSGLYYFNARWYDCELGRFTTQDPARDGVNWWAYCESNPLIYTDPDGRAVVGILLFSIATTYVVNNMPSKEEHYNRNDNQSQFSFARVEDAVRAGFTQLGTATGEDPEGLDNCHENGLGIPNPSGNNK